jgi:exodeoxyribonuclease V alpha subunit
LNAHRVQRGDPIEFQTTDISSGLAEFYFLEQTHREKMVQTIIDLCTRVLPQRFHLDPIRDVQVLTPMHKGSVGTLNLNQALQKTLNPKSTQVESTAGCFKAGDKVIHLKNNYHKEVFNGDIGTICSIDGKHGKISVVYDHRTVVYDAPELEALSLAYAITVHKSQGSEYPAVILPVTMEHAALLQRNLLYTGITRGKRLVILTGSLKALAFALNNDRPHQRLSKLKERLGMIG